MICKCVQTHRRTDEQQYQMVYPLALRPRIPRRGDTRKNLRAAVDEHSSLQQIVTWLDSPRVFMIGETSLHLQQLKTLTLESKIIGPAFHDARIAAICLQHGVTELWTADRDFSRYPKLKMRNPLIK